MIYYIARNEEGRRILRTTQADARDIDKNFEQVDVPTDKPSLLIFLQELYSRMDDLEAEPIPPVEAPPPVKISHADQIVAFEDEWENFPMSKKAHFAALFCDEARYVLTPELISKAKS